MPGALPTTALLALTPLHGPHPLLTHALPWAEALHAALVKASDDGGDRGPSHCLTGRDDFGNPLTGHQHAFVLPLSLGTTGATGPAGTTGSGEPSSPLPSPGSADAPIDHALIHAPMGLDAPARAALTRIERLWLAPRSLTLRVELLALGLREDLAARVPALRPATAWRSVTPFVAPRHIKERGRNTVEEQIQAELAAHGLPRAAAVEVETDQAGRSPHWARFVLERQPPDRRPPIRMGFGVRLRFIEPVPGPPAIGYAAHFGLGQLVPA
ncbi:MAG: type I-U CRISPR-associated protein Csb2 [Minicystis sp.]